jgi:hypothetical protein
LIKKHPKGEVRQQSLYGSMIQGLTLANKAIHEPYHNFENRMDIIRVYMFGKEYMMFKILWV